MNAITVVLHSDTGTLKLGPPRLLLVVSTMLQYCTEDQ